MKQILMALAILGYTYTGAEAQTKTTTTTRTTHKTTTNCSVTYGQNYKVCKKGSKYYTCGVRPSTQTCKSMTAKPHTAVLAKTQDTPAPAFTGSANSPYAENYSVCKGNGDYHICNESPNSLNSVKTKTVKRTSNTPQPRPITKTTEISPNGVIAVSSTQTYTGNYPNEQQNQVGDVPQNQSLIMTDNTLEPVIVVGRRDSINNANAPYHGKNSPQYDGVERNKARNLNTPPQSPNATFDGK